MIAAIGGSWPFDLFSQCELIKEHIILGIELLLDNLIAHIKGEPPFFYGISNVLSRIWGHGAEVHIAKVNFQVYEKVPSKRVDLACNFKKGVLIEVSPEVNVRHRAFL